MGYLVLPFSFSFVDARFAPSIPQPPSHDRLLAPHGRRIVLVTPAALLALPPGVSRVLDLGARDGADVDALADGLVRLEARRALLLGPQRRVLYPVARVGADVDGLPDDVVGGVAVLAEPERVLELGARVGAEEGALSVRVCSSTGAHQKTGWPMACLPTCATDCFCPMLVRMFRKLRRGRDDLMESGCALFNRAWFPRRSATGLLRLRGRWG